MDNKRLANVELLFPTPVMFGKLDRDYTQDEMDFFDKQERYNNLGNLRSKDGYILNKPEMASLKDFVVKFVDSYVQSIYKPRHPVTPWITQSWLNWTSAGQYHHAHEHPNSFLSGVLYINASKKEDKIYFHHSGYRQIRLESDNWDMLNSRSWWFGVETKDIVLFPSNVTHNVDTVKHENTRLSLAFNTFLKGTLGDETELTEMLL